MQPVGKVELARATCLADRPESQVLRPEPQPVIYRRPPERTSGGQHCQPAVTLLSGNQRLAPAVLVLPCVADLVTCSEHRDELSGEQMRVRRYWPKYERLSHMVQHLPARRGIPADPVVTGRQREHRIAEAD